MHVEVLLTVYADEPSFESFDAGKSEFVCFDVLRSLDQSIEGSVLNLSPLCISHGCI